MVGGAAVSEIDTLVEKVRKRFGTQEGEHHNLCDSRYGRKCDCYARHDAPGHAALTELAKQARQYAAPPPESEEGGER